MNTLLPVDQHTLVLDARTVPDAVFEDQLERLTNRAPIVVRDAVRTSQGDSVRVEGRTDLLGMTDMKVTVVARPGVEAPRVTLRFSLIEGRPGTNAWTFGRSFPDLPPFFLGEDDGPFPGRARNALDELVLADAAFLLTTVAGKDPITGAALEPGLNFAARCTPTGLVGLLGSALSGGGEVVLAGPVVVPRPQERTAPIAKLPLLRYPWQLAEAVPGIHLFADLGVERSLGRALRLHDVGLRLYCPISREWMLANPTFGPVTGASASVESPKIGKSLDVTAVGSLSAGAVTLFGVFDDVRVTDLAALVDLAGDTDLAGGLPDDVRARLDALDHLSLEAVQLSLGPGFELLSAGLAVGLRDLDTRVLPGLQVESLLANFLVTQPFTSPHLSVTLGGRLDFLDAPFDVALDLPGVHATARMAEGRSVPLGRLFETFGLPEAPAPLEIAEFQLEADRDGSLAVATTMAPAPGWTIDLGPVPLTFSEVTVLAHRTSVGSGGSISGRLAIGDSLEFAGSFDTPGDFFLRGELPDTSLRQIVAGLTDRPLPVPGSFDLVLEDSIAQIRKSGNDLAFQVATTMDGLGTAALEVRRVGTGSGAWGVAAGLQLVQPRLSALPGLGALKGFEDVFRMDELVLVVSSFDDPGFQFPALNTFQSPLIRAGEFSPPAGGVIAGLNVHARWTIDTSDDGQRLLQRFLGLDPSIGVTLQVGEQPTQDSRLFVSYDTRIQGHPLRCEFGGQLRGGQVGLFLTGRFETEILGRTQEWSVTTTFVPNGAFLSGSMEGGISYEGFTLSNLALVAGISFEGIPTLGVAASLSFDDFDSSLAILFDSTNPANSLLAGSVSDLSLVEVVEKIAGASAPAELETVLPKVALVGTTEVLVDQAIAGALDALDVPTVAAQLARGGISIPTDSKDVLIAAGRSGQDWFLTDMRQMLHYQLARQDGHVRVTLEPQFYCAPQTTVMGDLRFDQGVFLNAGLEVLSFDAEAKILVKPSRGISIDGHMDRIVLGHEKLFSLTADSDVQKGPTISAATFDQPTEKDADRRKPHFFLDGEVTLLGIRRGASASLSSAGFRLHLDGTLIPGLGYDLDAHFAGPEDLGIGGSLTVGIDSIGLGPLGSVDLGATLTVQVDAGVDAQHLWVTLAAPFRFAGHDFRPELHLDIATQTLEQLPGLLLALLKKELLAFFSDAGRWLAAAKSGLVTGAQEVGKVLHDAFGLTAQAAATAMKQAGHAAGEVAHALQQGYGVVAAQAAQFLESAGYAVSEVAQALQSAFGTTAQEVATLLRNAGHAASEVGGAIARVFGLAAAPATQALEAAGYAAGEVGHALQAVFGTAPADAARILRTAGFAVAEVGGVLSQVYGMAGDQAASFLRGAGYGANEVGRALQGAFSASPQDAVRFLRGAGFPAGEIGSALSVVFGVAAGPAAMFLAGAGFAAQDVGNALRSVFGTPPQDAARFLRSAGFPVQVIGATLVSVWSAPVNVVGSALKAAGFPVAQVGDFLRTTFHLGPDALRSVMTGIGFAAGEVKGFFQGLGGEFSKLFSGFLDKINPFKFF